MHTDIVNCIVCDAVKLNRTFAKKECKLVNRKGKNEVLSMETDYSVTWNDIKNRVEKWLKEKRGIDGNDPIPMGTIDYAMTKVWNEFCDEKDKE